MVIPHSPYIEGTHPLSSSQTRIWFMENFNKEMAAYNIPLDFKITGNLNVDLLQRSINFLIERHEGLRTIFPDGHGTPGQKVLRSQPASITIVHLENEPPEKKAQTVAHRSRENSKWKFDLMKGPLFHFELLVLGGGEYVFLANFHHIISDAASVGIFFDELKTVYQSLLRNEPPALSPLPITYTDYVAWERQWMTGAEYRKQLEYWKEELSGAPDVLPLPTDFPRPKVQSYRGAEYDFIIEASLREMLSVLSRKHKTSMFVPLLAAYGVLLSRYASQSDLVIGVPVANRLHDELESVIGVLINSLPVRLDLPGDMTFSEAVGLTKTKFLSAYENQEVAFERLVEELKVKRNTSSSPVFQVIFNFLTDYQKEILLPGLKLERVPGERTASSLDLILTVNDTHGSLNCTVEYNTDLFAKETIARMAGHYMSILHSIAENEDLPLKRIPLLTPGESNVILSEWNQTAVEYPRNKCTHHIFEEQVARTPDAVAVTDDHSRLTYAELNARANRLARYLVRHGAREDTFVAVYLDRNIDLIISLLAVAKTGSTYLPLDPIFPKERIRLIIEDAGPVLLITQSALTGDLPSTNAEVILVDDRSKYLTESEENLSFGNSGKAAFILYTSGSTGKPKGVMVKHHSTVNAVAAITKLMDVSSEDILLSATTFTFDVAEMEMYLPLFNGARLVVASQETVQDIDRLKARIKDSGATLFLATPVTFKMLILSSWEGKSDLRVLSGGEGLPKEIAKEMLARCRGMWNGYAPTETTIYSLIKKITPDDLTGDGYVSLGRPIDNNILEILSPGLVPVPVGIPGELYIGGEGVSLGYLNLPELTRERFIPDPLGNDPSLMFYKTGDLVRYTPEGNVIFLNRVDFQVKIRGFRIELGEIESVLLKHEGIKEAVVVVKEDPSREKMLAAYLVMQPGNELNPHALRTFLKEKLPDYMVPSAFVTLDQFPLTSTLKVDRKALPEPESAAASLSRNFVEPSTPTEKKLARIWESLLKTKKIGIHDDFFDIGGHSLIAVTMVVKIEQELGMRIPIATLFDRSTISGIAELIDQGPDNLTWRSLVPIRPAGSKKPLFLIHGMGLNVLLYTSLIKHLDPDQPVYGLQAKGLNGSDAPLESMEDIASYYISEIMTVDPDGPYAMAGFSLGGRIAYEMARQLFEMGKKVSFLGLFDATADESFASYPFFEKNRRRIRYAISYTIWNVSNFLRDKNESKLTIMLRRWRGLERRMRGLDFKIDDRELVSFGRIDELPKYLRKVHRANKKADRNYIIKNYPGKVHLFKAQKQTFYLSDPIQYGWDKVAKGGVVVHVIPGEHSNTFAPPNDQYFANVLQSCLNENTLS
jgi:amino acid adenylation domain-containing protein